MSLMEDPKQIADWLIERAGSTLPGAESYKQTIIKAKGLLLSPAATGEEAVTLARAMSTQGADVRAKEAAGTSQPPGQPPQTQTQTQTETQQQQPTQTETQTETQQQPQQQPTQTDADVNKGKTADELQSGINAARGSTGAPPAPELTTSDIPRMDAIEADALKSVHTESAEEIETRKNTMIANALGKKSESAANATTPLLSPSSSSSGPTIPPGGIFGNKKEYEGKGRRTRKTRHRTPKRKKLSRKKSVKRK